MVPRAQNPAPHSLDLPPEFEDLTGHINGDVKVIVSILADRASERLMLSKGQSQQLRRSLWDRLVDAVNAEIKPLSAHHR